MPRLRARAGLVEPEQHSALVVQAGPGTVQVFGRTGDARVTRAADEADHSAGGRSDGEDGAIAEDIDEAPRWD